MSVRLLLFVDGCGALLTATALGAVSVWLAPEFGVPRPYLVALALVALGFALYSLTGFALHRGATWLRGIAVANTLYCAVTATLTLTSPTLTPLGFAYFLDELGVVLALVVVELRAAARG